MKGITVLMSSEKLIWETPRPLGLELKREFALTLDVAASARNTLCDRYIDRRLNAFTTPWNGRCWLNPPYGRDLGRWADRVIDQIDNNKRCSIVVALVAARTDTRWWRRLAERSDDVRFLPGRVRFTLNGKPRTAATFPSSVLVLRQTQLHEPVMYLWPRS